MVQLETIKVYCYRQHKTPRLNQKNSKFFLRNGKIILTLIVSLCYSGRMTEKFISDYPNTSNAELARLFDVPLKTVRWWAQKYGLKKSATYLAQKQGNNSRGHSVSPEHREKLRQNRLGKTMSKETAAKIIKTKRERGTLLKGEKHPSWKGGKPWLRFKDERYVAWRNAVLERDSYVCQDCGRQCKKRERGLAAHHLKSYTDYPEFRYDIANGLTLCRMCHMTRHGRRPRDVPPIPCACGCGTLIAPYDIYHKRPRQYVNHHASRGRTVAESTKEKLRQQRKGGTLTPEHRAKIASGLRNTSKRIGRPPKKT